MKKKEMNETDRLFQNSAKLMKNRIDPIDCIIGYEPPVNKNFFNRILDKYEKFKNHIYILQNKRRLKKLKILNYSAFKREAIHNYIDYYKGLYLYKSSDVDKLKTLIEYYDTPDYENPFMTDSIEFCQYDENGFLSTEIRAILTFVFMRSDKKNEEFDIDLQTIEIDDTYDNVERYYGQALISLAYLFFYGNNFDTFRKNIHHDNIEISIIEMLMHLDFNNLHFSANDLIEKIDEMGFLKSSTMKELIKNKK